jgi:hypothetical protein
MYSCFSRVVKAFTFRRKKRKLKVDYYEKMSDSIADKIKYIIDIAKVYTSNTVDSQHKQSHGHQRHFKHAFVYTSEND